MATAIRLYWSELAIQDLSRIARHVSASSPHHANKLLDRIDARVQLLVAYPDAGRVGSTAGTRELVVHKHYLTIYHHSEYQVTVLRVKHVARKTVKR